MDKLIEEYAEKYLIDPIKYYKTIPKSLYPKVVELLKSKRSFKPLVSINATRYWNDPTKNLSDLDPILYEAIIDYINTCPDFGETRGVFKIKF